jgi:rfaE bifunctional protein nucleotidyltransferase chain/domain
VTLDVDGAVVFERARQPVRLATCAAPASKATGAGDTFTAALTLALAAGASTVVAAELASLAAQVVVTSDGTSACRAGELRQRLLDATRTGTGKVVRDRATLERHVQAWRARSLRIVFTNGCFDLLHAGHIACLNQAKRLGDVLVVAVNSDRGVRRLKGRGRPVHPAGDRAAVLAALSCVDHVTVFDTDDAIDLVRRLRPDVYVKGGDHAARSLPEAAAVRECGGEVRLLDYLPERSSTAVIDRIRAFTPA